MRLKRQAPFPRYGRHTAALFITDSPLRKEFSHPSNKNVLFSILHSQLRLLIFLFCCCFCFFQVIQLVSTCPPESLLPPVLLLCNIGRWSPPAAEQAIKVRSVGLEGLEGGSHESCETRGRGGGQSLSSAPC